ncbi:tudor domain-containing 6-like isoform X2 [Gigantopelta aegis]|uniref:tudor domain-containing 6-like isoform X2 n=1 Tax=Gigantopelta aegis TaxID=1735272 RepID=UPI001B88B34E|nr:tudor domain-containing 6-like isoform X2 [Gigantopelta aegis]
MLMLTETGPPMIPKPQVSSVDIPKNSCKCEISFAICSHFMPFFFSFFLATYRSEEDMNGWDPRAEDFNDDLFNSYNMSIKKKQGAVQLFVTGIPSELTNDGLRNLFLDAGYVEEAKVVTSKNSRSDSTFGFVTMKSLSEAEKAMHCFEGYRIQRCQLHVKIAMTAAEKEAKLRQQKEEEEFLSSLGQHQQNVNNSHESDEKVPLDNTCTASSTKMTQPRAKGRAGMGRDLKAGQDAGTAFERPPLIHHPEPSPLHFGAGYGPGWERPPILPYPDHAGYGPSFGRGYWHGPPLLGPQGLYGFDHPLPRFRPGLSRGYGKYPNEFYNCRPQAPRPYNGYGEERRQRPRDEGFNRTFITPAAKETEKRKQKFHCIACKQPASKKCGRCKLPYCSSTCQKKHFPEHKETCLQLSLMARNDCDPEKLDSQFDVTVNMDDVTQFQRSFDQLVTDVSDSESLISREPRPIRKNAHRREKVDKSKTAGQAKADKPVRKPVIDVKIKNAVTKHVYREYDIITMTLPIKTKKKVWVSHVDSPSEVWIQVASEDLTMVLTNIAAQTKELGTFEGNPQIGDLCLAKAVNEKWYRSSVVAVKSSGQFQVRYLDFGNMCCVSATNLQPLPKSMLSPSAQAVRCCIAGILPVKGSVWSDEAKKVVSSIVRTDTDYTVEAIEKHGDLYLINLYENNSGINIIQRLISARVATPVLSHSKIMASDMKSLVDELQVGQELNLYFVDCKSPSDFTAQILEEVRVQQFQQMLRDVVEDMAANAPITPYRPEVGEMVFGRYTADDCWTRAEVINVTDIKAKIRYIDYGNIEELEFSRITALKQTFSSLPGQAIRCFLSVQQTPKQWSDEDIAKFKEQIGFGTELAHICVVKAKSADRIGLEIFTASSQPLSDMFSALQPAPHSPAPEPALPIMADSLQSVTLPVDASLVRATVVDIVSFNNFSIHLVSETSIQYLKQLMLDISTYVESAEDRPNPIVGELVCAKFSDGQWYRCKVEQVKDDHCVLLFVDFGNEDKVSKTLIKTCDKTFVNMPIQAVKGRLAGAVKTSEADLQSFATLVLSCVNKFKVLSYDSSEYEVEIFLSDGQCLNDRFREAPLATSKDPAMLEKSSLPVQTSLTITAIKPVLHEIQPVAISFVTDPGNFCCQLLRKEFKELSQITPSMVEYCTKDPVPKGFSPQVGDFCFGQFSGSFYRARVEKKLPKGLFELKYVDYGNVESVSIDDMRPMVKEFAEIPYLAVRCSLHGLQPKEGSWSEKCSDMLRQFMGKIMMLKVEDETNASYSVSLVQNEKPNVHVAEMLLNKGFALSKLEKDEPSASTPTKQSVSPTIPSLAGSLHVGQQFQVIISNYCPPDRLTVEIVDQEILDKRNELQAELNQAVANLPTVGLSPQVGDYVVAQFSEDQQWYRAKVEIISDTKLSVFYVDFGNKEDVELKNIRPLPTEWSKQPAFVVNCIIEGVHRANNDEVLMAEKGELCQKILGIFLLSVEMPLAQAEVKSLEGDLIGIDLYKDNYVLSSELTSVLSSKKPSVVMSSDMSSAELPIDGSLVDCEFIHVEDLTNFFVRKDDIKCRTALHELMVNLNSSCKGLTESHKPIVGEVVAVNFSEDNTWNRGLVFEVTGQSCRVNFIDFGNSEQATFSSIRKLDSNFSKLPVQAIPCGLVDVPQKDLSSEKVKQTFMNLVAAKKVKVKVVPSDNQHRYAIEVFLPDGSNVRELLHEKEVTPTVTVESLTYHQPTEAEFQVAIQDVVSPSQFYCTELDIKAMEEQTALNAALTECCHDPSTPRCTDLKVGDLCCGLFDGEWFRGEVKKVLPGNRVSLFYIDYGNTNEVDLSDTRILLKEHAQAKVMAIHCKLHDVHPVGAEWDAKAVEFLSQRKEKLLNASVVNVQNHVYKIQLTDPETDTDLAKEMVINGLALDDATIKKQIEALSAKLALS